MDIKAQVEKIVKKLLGDKDLLANFKKEPVKVVEKVIGKDLPDDVSSKIVSGVKAKLAANETASAAEGVVDKVKGLFSK